MEGQAVQRRPRGRPRRAAARREIVAATLELLAERGFQTATMEAIAGRAGVGKNTIYRRWASKEELIADALGDLTAEAEIEEDDVRAALVAHVREFTRIFADPLLGRILPGLLGELHSNPEFAEVWAERVVQPRREAIVDLLRSAVERGELRDGLDLEAITDLLVGPPFVRSTFPFGLPELTAEYAEDLVQIVWGGLEPHGRRR
ncbi:MAG TPA: TetR/AcrR family transcriptional regulator [Gaiellaceae bacterium]|nr:TetR/AcrR family transcriptional regulator [Gaiellaceae bacterium]